MANPQFPSRHLWRATLVASLVAACGGPDFEPVSEADFEPVPPEAGSELVGSVGCPPSVGAETNLCSGVGSVWPATLRVGALETSIGELAQTFVSPIEGRPDRAVLKLRSLRPIGPAPVPDFVVELRRLSTPGVIPTDAASVVATGRVSVASLDAEGETTVVLGSPLAGTAARIEAGRWYALTLSATRPAAGGVLVGVAALQTNALTGEVYRRALRGPAGGPLAAGPWRSAGLPFDVSFRLRIAPPSNGPAGMVQVAVGLSVLGCSAKSDCGAPLFDPANGDLVGARTLAIACESASGGPLAIYLSNLALSCDGGPAIVLDPLGTGQHYGAGEAPAGVVQVATYRTAATRASVTKSLSVAVSVAPDLSHLEGLGGESCRLRATASPASTLLPANGNGFLVSSGAPLVEFDVPIATRVNGTLTPACDASPLGGPDGGVQVRLLPGEATRTLEHRFAHAP